MQLFRHKPTPLCEFKLLFQEILKVLHAYTVLKMQMEFIPQNERNLCRKDVKTCPMVMMWAE